MNLRSGICVYYIFTCFPFSLGVMARRHSGGGGVQPEIEFLDLGCSWYGILFLLLAWLFFSDISISWTREEPPSFRIRQGKRRNFHYVYLETPGWALPKDLPGRG
jgi:hypothetical protein